eukprot:jgi/Tetstr1/437259/TSEL_025989.t1
MAPAAGSAPTDDAHPEGWEEFAAKSAKNGCLETTGTMVYASAPRALQIAASEGSAAIVEILLKAGADVNRSVGQGYTALDFAVFGRHHDCALILLQNGADPEKMNCEGISPLARATQRKDGKMLSMMRASECAPSDGNEAQ